MKKTTIKITVEQEKVDAIKIYIADKNGDLEEELTDFIDVLYKKYVPSTVREFMEKTDIMEAQKQKKTNRRVTAEKPLSRDLEE